MIIIKAVTGFFAAIGILVSIPVGIAMWDSIEYNWITGKPVCRCSYGTGTKPNGRDKQVFLWSPECGKHRDGPPQRAIDDEPFHRYASIASRKKRSRLWPDN